MAPFSDPVTPLSLAPDSLPAKDTPIPFVEGALIGKSAYARHRGVTPAQVTHWIRGGRIVIVDGKVDVHQSDTMLRAFAEAARRARAPRTTCPHCGAPAAPQSIPAPLRGVLGAIRMQLLSSIQDHMTVLETQFVEILRSAQADAGSEAPTAGAPAERITDHGN